MKKNKYILFLIFSLVAILVFGLITFSIFEREVANKINSTENYGVEVEGVERLAPKEALDILFEYLYADENYLIDVTFYEEDGEIGYVWLRDFDMNCPMFLETAGSRLNGLYQMFLLGSHLYDLEGTFIRDETRNKFAVNIETGEIIEVWVFDEYGMWHYSDEYRKYILEEREE